MKKEEEKGKVKEFLRSPEMFTNVIQKWFSIYKMYSNHVMKQLTLKIVIVHQRVPLVKSSI